MKRPRILQFLSSASWGGAERMVMTIVQGLDPGRFSVEIAFFLGDGPVARRLREMGFVVHLFHWSPWRTVNVVWDINRFLRHGGYDIVHLYGYKLNMLVRPVAAWAGVPVVVTGQRSVDLNRRPWHSWLDRITSRWVTAYFSNSLAAAELLVLRERIDPAKVYTVPNGLDVEPYLRSEKDRRCTRMALGLEESDILVAVVANLKPVKGHAYFLEAFATLVRDFPRFVAILIGDGPLLGELQEQANRLGIAQRVRFLGQREDVPHLLAAADLFVLPSLWEGLPVSILEAMASAVAVVATNVGGVGEIVVNGKTGLLVPPADAKALAHAMRRALSDAEARRRMGLAGRERVRRYFSAEAMVRRTEVLYECLLSRSTGVAQVGR